MVSHPNGHGTHGLLRSVGVTLPSAFRRQTVIETVRSTLHVDMRSSFRSAHAWLDSLTQLSKKRRTKNKKVPSAPLMLEPVLKVGWAGFEQQLMHYCLGMTGSNIPGDTRFRVKGYVVPTLGGHKDGKCYPHWVLWISRTDLKVWLKTYDRKVMLKGDPGRLNRIQAPISLDDPKSLVINPELPNPKP